MTFLDIFNRVPLSVVLPITILVLGLILYFKFPKNRKDIGIVYSSLGIVGVFIYSVSFYIDTLSYGFPFVLLGVLIVEIATVIVGAYSFKNNKKKYNTHNEKMINYFTFGAIGSLISAISIGVIFYAYIAYSLFPPNLISSGRVVAILFGVGILLASFGYRAIKNKYGLLSGKVGFGLGIITSVLIFSNTMVGVFTQDIMFYEIPTFSNYIDFLFSLPLLLFFGLTLVIWGIAHFKSRKFYKKLNVITSGFFIVSGGSILSVFYRDFWLIFSVASLLFASIVFLISSFGINHKNKSDEYLLK